MSTQDTNSIRYPRAVDEKLGKLAVELGRSKKELFCQMVDYFYRSKKDPADPGDELLKKEISSGISRILAFIRQQEKDFLLPVFSDTGLIKTSAARQVELLEALAKHILHESEKNNLLLKRSESIISGLKHLLSKQKEKDLLKKEFTELLDYYISRREELGWSSSSGKKEELIGHVRETLKNM